MKPIRIENGVAAYYGNLAGRIQNGQAVVDPMFQVPELKELLEKQRNVSEIKWQNGIFDQLASEQGETREIQNLENCWVWQLKSKVDIYRKFVGYDALVRKFGMLNPKNYRLVLDSVVNADSLEAPYTKFNVDYLAGYAGHPLPMSDALGLYDEPGGSSHYLDSFDFKQADFEPPDQEMVHIQAVQL